MGPYFLKRLLEVIPTLLILVTLTFFLLRLAPGGPFDSDQVWPPEIQANIARKYDLDKPLHLQFLRWLQDLSQGDLRESFQYLGRPVMAIIRDSLPISFTLGIGSLFVALGIGIPLGAVAAWSYRRWLDRAIMFFAVSGVSLPAYLVATLLILVLSLWLKWFPPALWEDASSMVLPILTLAWRPLAMVSHLTRATLLEVLDSEFIRTARGKGLPESQVIFKHALKNSLIPVITILGPLTANLITGSFLVETVFQIPGMGKHFVQAVLNRDYPLVMGVTLVYGIVLTFSNIGVDLLYAWIDPRVRIGEEA